MSVVTQPTDDSRAANTEPLDSEANLGNSANGAAVIERQNFQRVSAEEAATLPYEELRRRMELDARLTQEGLLPTEDGGSREEAQNPDADAETGGAENPQGAQRGSNEQAQTGQPEAQRTTQQVGNQSPPDEAAQLRAELARIRQEQADAARNAEQARLLAHHQQVEQNIARLPQQAQQAAREDYGRQLHQAQLNDYNRFLATREQAIFEQEFKSAKRLFNDSIDDLSSYVANQFEVKPDALASFAKSKEAQELIAASETPQAFQVAIASIGQTMEWLASQEQARLNAQREQRRQRDAGKVQRDVPQQAQGAAAGGGIDEVARINAMPREDFFKWKQEQLRAARAAQDTQYA